MAFSSDVVKKAWKRSGGRCEQCKTGLVYSSRGRNERGCWEPHHILPRSYGGGNCSENCAILCTGPKNCHLNAVHNGNYSSRGDFNRMSNEPWVRALPGALLGGRFFGPVGFLLGGLFAALTAPDLTKN